MRRKTPKYNFLAIPQTKSELKLIKNKRRLLKNKISKRYVC